MSELLRLGGELRFLPDLWPLRDAVVASTLRYSMIRMRNARPRAAPNIPEFGTPVSAATYVLRPGGYAVAFSATGDVATLSTPLGLMLPGGAQDDRESPEDAAVREVEEACGLRIGLGSRIGVTDELVSAADERTHYRKRRTYFFADVIGEAGFGEPDHQLVWLPPRDAVARLLHESPRWAVAEACRQTNKP